MTLSSIVENSKCALQGALWVLVLGSGGIMLMSSSFDGRPEVSDLNRSMFAAIERIEFHSFQLEKHERSGEHLGFEKWQIEINYDPYWIDMQRIIPEDGPSLYWKEGENGGDARVDPNGFPWIDLDLDPTGKTLTKDAHHTIFHLGFKHFGNIWRSLAFKDGALRPTVGISEAKHAGKGCWLMTVRIPEYSITTTTVEKGENALAIGERLMIPADKIVHLNETVDDLFDVKAGQQIKVPSHYAKEGRIWIDRSTWLPIKQEVFDENGLYERYVYSDLKIN